MKNSLLVIVCLLCCLVSFGQKKNKENDTLPYFERYKEKLTVRMGVGINDAPFNLNYKFPFAPHKKMKYQPNPQHVMGFGLNYFGLGVAFSFKLPTTVRNERLYGKSKYFDLEVAAQLKKWVIFADFRRYRSFAVSNLSSIDTSYVEDTELDVRSDMQSWTLATNVKYYFNEKYDYNSAKGFAGAHLRSAFSPFAMGIITAYEIDGRGESLLHPSIYEPSYSFSNMNKLFVFEYGAIPGFAYIFAHKGFNLHLNLGIGAVVQYQHIHRFEDQLGRWGISPKIDLSLDLGVNKPDWFLKLFVSYDWKYANIETFTHFHNYYKISIVGGYRFKVKTPKFFQMKFFQGI